MIAAAGSNPRTCFDCAHCAHGGPLHCRKATSIIDGSLALCADTRSNADLCGPDGTWFEQRFSISAIVDQAPVYGYSKGGTGKQYLGTLGDGAEGNQRLNQPIAENDKVRAYRPEDVNLDEWKTGKDQ